MKSPIPVFFSTDDKYVPYLSVALVSLIDHVSTDKEYPIFILHAGIHAENQESLESLSTENVIIRCCNVSKEMGKNPVHAPHKKLPAAATFRLLIPQLFPQYQKFLYLDSDVIVLRDVAELYDTDLGDCVLGAALHPDDAESLLSDVAKNIGVPVADYFNSGVLLINSRRFTELGIADKCFELLCKEHNFHFLDQDALNKTCYGNVRFFSRSWNCIAFIPPPHPPAFIIHFAGDKPWVFPYVRYHEYFWHYAKKANCCENILLSSSYDIVNDLASQISKQYNPRLAEMAKHIEHLAESVDKLAQYVLEVSK